MKKRLDQLLVDLKLASSRERAKRLIISKLVIVNNNYIIKAGTIVDEKINIIIKNSNPNKFVSRGGFKLEKAINKFNIKIKNKVCLDIGASTGGFSDCMLRYNPKLIYCLDVGYNQLAWKIRNNNKVVVMERINFKFSKKTDFNLPIEFSCCDVSFISLDKIIPPLKDIIITNGYSLFLIKPQFETERKNIKKGGRVTDEKVHFNTINKIIKVLNNNNFLVTNLDYSPILGNKSKNIEFIILSKKIENKINLKFQRITSAEIWNVIKKSQLIIK